MEGVTQPETIGRHPHREAAPSWLLPALILMLVAVIGLGWLVATRLSARRAEAARVEDPRVAILKHLVDENPDDMRARGQLAQVYLQMGRERDALRQYKAILGKNPDDISALYGAGVLHLQDGKGREGEKKLRRVLELDPANPYAAISLAQRYSVTERVESVVGVAKFAADAHPEVADLQYLVGLGYEETGKKQNAIRYYGRALKFVPEMKEAQQAMERLDAAP